MTVTAVVDVVLRVLFYPNQILLSRRKQHSMRLHVQKQDMRRTDRIGLDAVDVLAWT